MSNFGNGRGFDIHGSEFNDVHGNMNEWNNTSHRNDTSSYNPTFGSNNTSSNNNSNNPHINSHNSNSGNSNSSINSNNNWGNNSNNWLNNSGNTNTHIAENSHNDSSMKYYGSQYPDAADRYFFEKTLGMHPSRANRRDPQTSLDSAYHGRPFVPDTPQRSFNSVFHDNISPPVVPSSIPDANKNMGPPVMDPPIAEPPVIIIRSNNPFLSMIRSTTPRPRGS